MELLHEGNLETFYYSFTFKPLKNGEGKVWGILSSATDVTALVLSKQARIQEELTARNEQQKLVSLVENSADMIGVSNLEGNVIYLNKAGQELIGATSFEDCLRPSSDYFAAADLIKFQDEITASIAASGKWSGEIHYQNFQTGELIPCFINAFIIPDTVTGIPSSMASVTRDLRPELAAQKALADSEALLRNITTAAPAGLWMTDLDGRLTYVNEIWVNWTQKSFDHHLKQGWRQSIAKEDFLQANQSFDADFKSRRFHKSQFRIIDNEGNIRWISRTGNPNYNSEGQFLGYIGACVDITELKQLQDQKDEFINIASHELRTPLTSLSASLQILQRGLEKSGDKATMTTFLQKANLHTGRLAGLINDLLDVTKIERGRLVLNKSSFFLPELIAESCEHLSLTGTHEIIITGDPGGELFADKDRIDQVLVNMINNAIKYAPDSKIIRTTITAKEKQVRVSVQDYGPGIAADQIPGIFDRYFRADADNKRFSGLGLGLYISREIIKRHGGKIGVDSVPGVGSTFWFTLPFNKVKAESGNNQMPAATLSSKSSQSF